MQPFSIELILYLINLQKISLFDDVINNVDVIRVRSINPTTSKTEFSMEIVNELNYYHKNAISDAAILNTPLAGYIIIR